MSLCITRCRFCGRMIRVEDVQDVDSCREFIRHVRKFRATSLFKYCEQELEQIAHKCDSEAKLNRVEFV